jgi:hypothetical protein
MQDIIRMHYCIWGADGEERADRVRRVEEALRSHGGKGSTDLPDVPGVPKLRGTIEDVRQIPAFVREWLPIVECDPRLHALSFRDPLRLATDELGIRIAPRVARHVRRALRGAVSFDARDVDCEGRMPGITRIAWRPKR